MPVCASLSAKTASRPALCRLPAPSNQTNVGFDDVRVLSCTLRASRRCRAQPAQIPSLHACVRAILVERATSHLEPLLVRVVRNDVQPDHMVRVRPSLAWRGSGAVLFADGGFLGAELDASPLAAI
jgi:hypothetical protein